MGYTSLQVDISNRCNLKCKFCLSQMNSTTHMSLEEPTQDLLIDRLSSAQVCGCSTLVLSGVGEPLLNQTYLSAILVANRWSVQPFNKIELQTNGHLLTNDFLQIFKAYGGTTVAISVPASRHDAYVAYTGKPAPHFASIINMIHAHDLLARFVILGTKNNSNISPDDLLGAIHFCSADQVTFKNLISVNDTSLPGRWIAENSADPKWFSQIERCLTAPNKFGRMSIKIDLNCMEQGRYLVLRPWGLRNGWQE